MNKRIIIIVCFILLGVIYTSKDNVALAADKTISVNTDMQCVKDDKYYFSTTQAGILSLKYTSYATTKSDFTYYIYKMDWETGKSELVLCAKLSDNESVRIGTGYYYLSFDYYFYSKDALRLDYQTEDPDCYEQEGNDSFDSAQKINPNSMYTGSLGRDLGDYYKLVLDKQGSFSFYFKTENPNSYDNSNCIEIYSEDKYLNTSLIEEGEVDLTTKIYYSNTYRLPAGTYYIKIRREDDDIRYNTYQDYYNEYYGYQLKVNYQEENSDAYETESNNAVDSANTIKTNTNYTGNIQTVKDVDYYKFSVKNTSLCVLQLTQPRETEAETFRIDLIDTDNNEYLDTFLTTSNPTNFGSELILKQGNYYIKVTGTGEKDDSKINYKLNVNEKEVIIVKDIELTPSTTNIYSGITFNMKANVTPAGASKELSWSSTDISVAAVDQNGKVTCNGSGTCYIKADAIDGSGISQKYQLVVKQSAINTLRTFDFSKGNLSTAFSSNTKNYTLTLNKYTESVKLAFYKSSKYSQCYINDRSVNKVTVKLGRGKSTTLNITIVAENGNEKTYKLKVIRQ